MKSLANFDLDNYNYESHKLWEKIQFIEGSFTGDQTRQIVGAMVRHKIDYHTREKFGDEMRSGNAKGCSASRLENLRELEQELAALISDAQGREKKLEIRGTIEIVEVD